MSVSRGAIGSCYAWPRSGAGWLLGGTTSLEHWSELPTHPEIVLPDEPPETKFMGRYAYRAVIGQRRSWVTLSTSFWRIAESFTWFGRGGRRAHGFRNDARIGSSEDLIDIGVPKVDRGCGDAAACDGARGVHLGLAHGHLAGPSHLNRATARADNHMLFADIALAARIELAECRLLAERRPRAGVRTPWPSSRSSPAASPPTPVPTRRSTSSPASASGTRSTRRASPAWSGPSLNAAHRYRPRSRASRIGRSMRC